MSLQLRYLQTVIEIASENNSTTIFPIPVDIIKPFIDLAAGSAARTARGNELAAGTTTAALPSPDPTLPQFRIEERARSGGEQEEKK